MSNLKIENERLKLIQDEIKERCSHGESQRVYQNMLIARLSQEVLSMELEISQWKESATKHQTK